MGHRFQVDLAGMVDLLSHHLYSGPQVYLRELLQNAVDGITARRGIDPTAEATVRLVAERDADGRPSLAITDTGIGLSKDEAGELLATIGRSSKRDPLLGSGRSEFIGQFGIGMLAAFMVADEIEVTSQSARPGEEPIVWTGFADGTFELASAAAPRAVGTTVRLRGRADTGHWLETATVTSLATEYGSLLPYDVAVEVEVDGQGRRWRRVTLPELPWQRTYPNEHARQRALSDYCEEALGFTPIGHIELSVPLAGVSGVAFILPQALAPGSGRHRVYAKRMLVGSRVDQVMPDWGFFVRAVIDTESLSVTASREQFHTDEVLLAVQDALGAQLKAWAISQLSQRTELARRVIEVHHLSLRAAARADDELLDLVAAVLPYETTDGLATLTDAAAATGELLYTTTTEAYRRVAAVARAQGLVVVNAGYVYDADLLARLARRPGWRARELVAADLVQVLASAPVERVEQVRPALERAWALLEADDCEVILRSFEPSTVPAVLLRDPEQEHRRELERERTAVPGLWGGLLDVFATANPGRTRTLALNDTSPVVRLLLAAGGHPVFDAGLRSLYLSAVMLAGEGLRTSETTALHEALGVLLAASLDSRESDRQE